MLQALQAIRVLQHVKDHLAEGSLYPPLSAPPRTKYTLGAAPLACWHRLWLSLSRAVLTSCDRPRLQLQAQFSQYRLRFVARARVGPDFACHAPSETPLRFRLRA